MDMFGGDLYTPPTQMTQKSAYSKQINRVPYINTGWPRSLMHSPQQPVRVVLESTSTQRYILFDQLTVIGTFFFWITFGVDTIRRNAHMNFNTEPKWYINSKRALSWGEIFQGRWARDHLSLSAEGQMSLAGRISAICVDYEGMLYKCSKVATRGYNLQKFRH